MIIYLAISPSGKKYVGQSIRSLDVRWAEHCGDARANSGLVIHQAIRKYGSDSFTLEILKEVGTQAELDFYESFYIRLLNTKVPHGYNLTEGGEGCKGHSHPCSEETKKKISKIHKGKVLSLETRQKISVARKGKPNGWLGKKHSESARYHMSLSHIGKSLSIETRQKLKISAEKRKRLVDNG